MDDARPGFLEVDLVAHCGEDGSGFFLHTLCAVDVATGWLELQPVWGKGPEFINRPLYYSCLYEGITFTRSRPYRKNDSAHVEQKNGAIVPALVGYDRVLVGQRNLAHRRRLYRLAAVVADQFGHLGRPAAFEAHHPQPSQPLQHLPPLPHHAITLCWDERTS